MNSVQPMARFALFTTSPGRCGVAWSGDTVMATHLPEKSDAQPAARLLARISGAIEGARRGEEPGLFDDLPVAAKPRG